MTNRKLYRPNMDNLKKTTREKPAEVRDEKRRGRDGGDPVRRKGAPSDSTQAESFYLVKQMQGKTPMVVVLMDGEELRGWVEWYDRECVKINRNHGPNLLIYKHAIKYMFKESELKGS